MNQVKLILLALLVLGISAKYSDSPKYTFNGYFTSGTTPYLMFLSQDSLRMSLISNYSTTSNMQSTYNIDVGSRQCSTNNNVTLKPMGFPAQTNMLYFDSYYGRIVKMASPCGTPITIANLTNGISAIGFGSTDEESFVALVYNQSIIEYNVGSGLLSKTYILNSGEKVAFVDYSTKRDALWVGVVSGSTGKFVSFDTSSGSRKNDYAIESTMGLIKGNNDGDGFIGYSSTYRTFYKFDKNGNRNSIRNILFIFSQLQS
jgi:hypothetical protein